MVWECMGQNGVGIFVEMEGWMDAGSTYVSILEDKLLPSMENSGLSKKSIIFQQDNNPKYSSKRAQTWFKSQGIRLLDRPAQSPDLSPVEHLWKHLKKRPNGYARPAKGVWKLWERIEAKQGKIEVEECQKLMESMARILEVVIQANLGHTKY